MVLKTQPNMAADKRLDTSTTAHLEECQAKLERALEASYTLR